MGFLAWNAADSGVGIVLGGLGGVFDLTFVWPWLVFAVGFLGEESEVAIEVVDALDPDEVDGGWIGGDVIG